MEYLIILIGLLIVLTGYTPLIGIDLLGVPITLRLFVILQVVGDILMILGALLLKTNRKRLKGSRKNLSSKVNSKSKREGSGVS